jgi:predicted permease
LARLLLAFFPRDFRTDYQEEWLNFIGQQRAEDRYRTSVLGGLRFWFDVFRDVTVSGMRIRQEDRRFRLARKKDEERTISVGSILQDLRFAGRTLSRRPLYAGIAVLTLGLGIGAATSMFSVVDGVLLTESPFEDPDRLMSIWQRLEGRSGYTEAGEVRLQYTQYEALREHSEALEGVAVYAADWGETSMGEGSRPELVNVGASTASLLPVLGLTPIHGRWFLPEEEGEEAGSRAQVTVMSYDMWISRFGADREVLGAPIILNGVSYTCIGVLPPTFRLQWLSASLTGADDPGPRDFWVPVGSPEWGEAPGSTMWEAVGRLEDGVTREQARAEAGRILREAWPTLQPEAILVPRVEQEVKGIGSPILLLFGATGLLLLIACGNVAALSLGEVHGRVREVATRVAIGAGQRRIISQLMTESLVLGLAGAALGSLAALAGMNTLVSLAPPIPRLDQVGVDLRVLAFAALLGTLSVLLAGLVPALVTAREAVVSPLRSGGRAGSDRRVGLGRPILAGEIALTIVLLVAGGLLAQSLSRLLSADLGFDPERIVSLEVGLPDARYGWGTGTAWPFVSEVIRELESVPGATEVTAANALPFPGATAGWATRLHETDSTYLMPQGFNVAPGHLAFMDIPILEGRGFLPSDDAAGPPVIIVSESLARAHWGDHSPVGEALIYPLGQVTVVGVAGDTRQSVLQDEPPLTFWVPFAQHARSTVSFAVRTTSRPSEILPAMREALWTVDGELAITSSGTLESSIADSVSEERYRVLLMNLFAIMATVLAAVGIMGVTARQISHRTRELGIMKALGAEETLLLGEVVRSVFLTGAIGIGLGLAGAFLLRPLLGSFLFGIESFDPLTYMATGALFLLLTVAAGYLPGRRVLRVNPVDVLKAE